MTGLIEAEHIFKRYNYHPIIKDFSFNFQEGKNYAIKGSNGSGKSTLINLLSGYLSPSAGQIKYHIGEKSITRSEVYKYLTISSPYSSLVEDLSLQENFDFYKKFKTLQKSMSYKDLLNILEWKDPIDKHYAKFSSGMKQKASLALSFLADSPILFLDEPTGFLDVEAKEWYSHNFLEYNAKKMVIIASNDEVDFVNIDQVIQL